MRSWRGRPSRAGCSYPLRVGTSFVEYRGSGFWTRDAALETLLGLLVAELQPLCDGQDGLSAVLDRWTLQATAGFTGCVSADLDENLADPDLTSRVIAGLRHVLVRLPADGLVNAVGPGFLERADRVTAAESWHCPSALAPWVIEVGKALLDLVEGNLPATSDGCWFIDGTGRHKLPRT
jgi:hypothetical protein